MESREPLHRHTRVLIDFILFRLYADNHSYCEFMSAVSCLVQKILFCSTSLNLRQYFHLPPPSWSLRFESARWWRCPLMAEHFTDSCLLHFTQLWFSWVSTLHCSKKLLWWDSKSDTYLHQQICELTGKLYIFPKFLSTPSEWHPISGVPHIAISFLQPWLFDMKLTPTLIFLYMK